MVVDVKISVALVALILARTVDQVLYYRIAKMMPSYTWMFGAIIISTGYVLVLWPIVWFKMYVTKSITPEQRKFPHKALIIMASFDAAYNIITTWPTPYISGVLLNAMGNIVLPFTMIGSIFFLSRRYHWSHYTGALLVIVGIALNLVPSFQAHGATSGNIQPLLWFPVFIIGQIPSAASNVYKEGGLKSITSDVWHVNAWIGVYQLLWGAITLPTVFIPWPHTDSVISPSQLGPYLSDGFSCFVLGKNPPHGGDQCGSLLWLFCLYMVFNISFNQLMLYVFKEGSSVLATVASAVRLPIVDILLLWKFLAGPAVVKKLSGWDLGALALLVLGVVVYRWLPEIENKKEENANDVERAGLIHEQAEAKDYESFKNE